MMMMMMIMMMIIIIIIINAQLERICKEVPKFVYKGISLTVLSFCRRILILSFSVVMNRG